MNRFVLESQRFDVGTTLRYNQRLKLQQVHTDQKDHKDQTGTVRIFMQLYFGQQNKMEKDTLIKLPPNPSVLHCFATDPSPDWNQIDAIWFTPDPCAVIASCSFKGVVTVSNLHEVNSIQKSLLAPFLPQTLKSNQIKETLTPAQFFRGSSALDFVMPKLCLALDVFFYMFDCGSTSFLLGALH